MPSRKVEEGGWLHPSRLPLGAGWTGTCQAPGFEGTTPPDSDVRELCNLGYASSCASLPRHRDFDAVRFCLAGGDEQTLVLSYVCEAGHRPFEHGCLQYDLKARCWLNPHANPRVQKMAECYLESCLARQDRRVQAQRG